MGVFSKEQPPLPEQLLWLVDAPMFIDEKQVEAFYDAILRPDYEGTSLTLSDSLTKGRKFSGGMTIGAVLPWLKAEGTAGMERSRADTQGQETTLRQVTNPYRHLLALAFHYSTQEKLQERIVFAKPSSATDATKNSASPEWLEEEFSHKTPRAIVMLNLPKGIPLIPMALETIEGNVVPLFDDLAARLQRPGEKGLPKYPGRKEKDSDKNRREYWRWFVKYYDYRVAMETVEAAAQSGRISWIAFRLPIGTENPEQAEKFLHLHIATRGNYEAGVVAYNFIARGFAHGLRIVGTLKSEPDLNVLAIFER